MDYDKLSDEEINVTVTRVVRGLYQYRLSERGDYLYKEDSTGVYRSDISDYCNQPEHWGKLLGDNGLSIVYMKQDGWDAHALLDLGRGYDEQYNTCDMEIGRAIAVCYLKMKEGEK